jgi:hypothetical protein
MFLMPELFDGLSGLCYHVMRCRVWCWSTVLHHWGTSLHHFLSYKKAGVELNHISIATIKNSALTHHHAPVDAISKQQLQDVLKNTARRMSGSFYTQYQRRNLYL